MLPKDLLRFGGCCPNLLLKLLCHGSCHVFLDPVLIKTGRALGNGPTCSWRFEAREICEKNGE